MRGFSLGNDIISDGSVLAPSNAFGDRLQISADGRYLSVIGGYALQVADLSRIVADRGTIGDDNIIGDSRDDTLYGFAGNDILDGQAGNDVLRGGSGNDIYYVDSRGNQVIEETTQGRDVVHTSIDFQIPVNVEVLIADGKRPWPLRAANERCPHRQQWRQSLPEQDAAKIF